MAGVEVASISLDRTLKLVDEEQPKNKKMDNTVTDNDFINPMILFFGVIN